MHSCAHCTGVGANGCRAVYRCKWLQGSVYLWANAAQGKALLLLQSTARRGRAYLAFSLLLGSLAGTMATAARLLEATALRVSIYVRLVGRLTMR